MKLNFQNFDLTSGEKILIILWAKKFILEALKSKWKTIVSKFWNLKKRVLYQNRIYLTDSGWHGSWNSRMAKMEKIILEGT